MVKKRERLDVINDMLVAIKNSGNKIGPTRLLYASNLSSLMFKDYISELLDKKFIDELDEKGRKKYTLTDKGFEYIQKYKEIKNFIENFGL
jgi:predicted transcriptional regulator